MSLIENSGFEKIEKPKPLRKKFLVGVGGDEYEVVTRATITEDIIRCFPCGGDIICSRKIKVEQIIEVHRSCGATVVAPLILAAAEAELHRQVESVNENRTIEHECRPVDKKLADQSRADYGGTI